MSGHTLEIRMLWGDETLWVRHLTPPRTFRLDDASAPLVRVDRAGVRIVVPAGATAQVDGEARAEPTAPEVPLVPGRNVTMILASSHAASPYREARAGARLALTIALVPAVAAVGRRWSLGGAGRLLASTAVVASMVAGLFVEAAPAPPVDEDEAWSDHAYVIQQYLQEAAELQREYESEDENESLHFTEPSRKPPGYVDAYWSEHDDYPERPWKRLTPSSDGLEEETLEALIGLEPTPTSFLCGAFDLPPPGLVWGLADASDRTRYGFPTAHEELCAGRLTALSLRPWGKPPWLGLRPDSRPSLLWYEQLTAARRSHGLPPEGKRPYPRAGLRSFPTNPWSAPDQATDRAVHARLGAVRACLELGRDVGRPGFLDLRLAVGVDGAVGNAGLLGSTLADAPVHDCVLRALDGMVVSPPPVHAGRFTYRLTLGAVPRR